MMAISSLATSSPYPAPAQASAPVAPAPVAPAPGGASTASSGGATPAAPAAGSFSQVVANARAALDAGYQKLGHVADTHTSEDEWRNTVGLDGLDRQTLFAIASNQGGQFSRYEMDAANFIMTQRQVQAMTAANPTGQDSTAAYKAAIDYLDQASPEEKSTLKWAQDRAAAQAGYMLQMKNAGMAADNVDSGNPYVKLFVSAYDELFATGDTSQSVLNMPSWKKAMDLWNKQHPVGSSVSVTA